MQPKEGNTTFRTLASKENSCTDDSQSDKGENIKRPGLAKRGGEATF